MKLLGTHVDPHVGGAEVDIGIARKAEASNVEQRCHFLIRHGHIDMLQRQQVADILTRTIEGFVHELVPHGRELGGVGWMA